MIANTKKLLLLQLVLCLFCFLDNWYKDFIVSRFTIFPQIFIRFVLIILFFKLFRKSLKYLKSKSIIIKLLSYGLFMITIILSFYDFRLIKAKIELNLYEKERIFIINEVKNNNYSYYFENNIKLPIYRYTSADGEIYVYKNDEDQVIGFWIYRGIMSRSIELIYSSKGEKLIYETTGGHPVNKIIKLKEHWYYVIKDY